MRIPAQTGLGQTARAALLTLAVVLVTACGDPSHTDTAARFYEGTWQIGAPLDPSTFYRISLSGEHGELSVETEGLVARTLPFTTKGADTIVFDGVSRGPHVLGDGPVDTAMLVDILRLVDPPKELRFVEDGPRPEGIPAERRVISVDGLMEGFPIPVPMLSMNDGERAPLPFSPITGDVDLGAGNVIADAAADGEPVDASAAADDPQPPEGEIHTLTIAGHDVPLASTKLTDGMLATTDFGKLEIVTGAGSDGGLRVQATPDQIRAIAAWLDAQQ